MKLTVARLADGEMPPKGCLWWLAVNNERAQRLSLPKAGVPSGFAHAAL